MLFSIVGVHLDGFGVHPESEMARHAGKMARVNFAGTLSKIFKKLLMLSYFVNSPQIVSWVERRKVNGRV
jgi:hypothetical protein